MYKIYIDFTKKFRNLTMGDKMIFAEIDYIGLYVNNKPQINRITKERPVIMFEINFCIDDGGISYINNKPIPIQKNSIICAKPGQTRRTKLPLKCYYIHFDVKNDELRNFLFSIPDAFIIENKEKYKKIFVDACKYFNRNSDESKIMLESLILKLIYLLKRDTANVPILDSPLSKQTEIIKKAVKYIKENLNKDLSLETLSRQFSLSPTHFHNTFKEAMNKTPRAFVEERRIKKSIDLLLTTETPISEIAYECGFTSQSYFCYAFKRYTGTTPKKYVESFNKTHKKPT